MKITDSIFYVGVNDYDIDLFESQYPVPNGVSYNSYVIIDEKIAIMDTADARVSDKWFENLQEVLADRQPDYLVISHMEPDHAANIEKVALKYPSMKLVGNAKTFVMMKQFFETNMDDRSEVVKEGDTLNLGQHELTFIMAPMVHWPEVMVEYESSEKILFSADGFGKFGTLDTDEEWTDEARRYYINIVGKYGMQVQALLKKASALDINMICPLHGPTLTDNLSMYLDKYNTWSSYQPEDKGTVVACASIHGNTRNAALKLVAKLEDKGEKVVFFDLSRSDISKVVEAAYRYDKLVLACATYDGGLFPCMEDLIHHLKAKNFQKRTVGLIENGTWAPMAAKLMKTALEGLKEINILEPVVSIKSTLNAESEKQMDELVNELQNVK